MTMPDDQNNNSAGPTDDQNQGAGSSTQTDYEALVKQAQADAADWKKRFNGLQGTYQREKEKWTADTARLQELDGTVKSLDDERTRLRELAESLPTVQAQLSESQQKFEKLHTIATKFPTLLGHYRDGLLPEGTGEEWEAKLEKLASTYAETSKQAVEDFAKGGTPRPPGGQPSGPNELFAGAVAAFKKGDMETYRKLYDEYYAALNSKSK